MGFQPFMLLHVLLLCMSSVLYGAKKRIRPDLSAFIMIGILSLFLVSGVATLGLLSATFVLAPMIALYLMLLGHRKSAYISIVITFMFLSIMGALFVSGIFTSAALPDLYVRSSTAWMLIIVAVAGVSIAFVAPLEFVPGALEGSEERFRLAFENANVGICLTSPEGRLLKVNAALCEMLGYRQKELEQMSISDITYQEDRNESINFITHAAEDGKEKINLEKRYVHKRGDIVWANVSSSLIRDSSHRPQYFITHVKNITERKQGEEKLQHALEWQEAIFEGSRDSVFISDQNSRFVAVNKAACELTGYSREQLLRMHIPDLHDQPDLAAYNNYNQKIFDGEEIVSEAKILRRDGSKVDAEFNNKRVSIAGVLYMHTTARDITERKEAEKALRNSEERFRSMYENSSLGLYRTAPDGKIILANPALVKKLGYSSFEDLAARNLQREGFEPSYERKQFIDRIELHGEVNGLESAWTCNDGSVIYVRESARAIRDPQGNTLYYDGTVEDITERKQAEIALRASESQFRELWGATVEGITIQENGIVVEVNDAMCRMFGYTREQVIGKSLLEFAPVEMHAALLEYMASGVEARFETPALRSNGARLVLEVFSKPILYQGKNLRMAAVRDITERKQIEDALRNSEERYQRITAAITDYIYTVRVENGKATKTTHGPGCVTVTGYEQDDFKNDPFLWFNMVLPEDRLRVEDQARLILTGENPSPLEHRIVHKNGSLRWVRNTFVLHRDDEGAIVAYDGLVQDITDRKQAERALQESEFKYRQLVEGFPDAIAIYVDGKIVFANSASVVLVRASSMEELIGKPVLDLVHPGYRQMIVERMKEVLSTKQTLPLLEEKFIRLDGSEVDVEVKALPVTFGNRPAVQLIVRDISERKQTEEALHESQLRYRAAVEQSNEGITIADLDGRYIMVNPAFCRMTGYSETELLSIRVIQLMPKRSSLKLFTRVADQHASGQREVELMRKDGSTFIALITGSALEVGGRHYVQGLVQDITERKRAEEALRESEERFHSMFEMHDAAMLLIEPISGEINDANPAAERFYGYSVNELRGMCIQDINMMSSGEVAAERSRASESEKNSFVFAHRLANGTVRSVEVHSSPIILDGKRRLFSIIHDITERREAEKQLRKLSLAIEQSPASIVITDTQGNIEYINPKYTQVTGYTMDEVLGKKPSILKSGETSQEEYRRLWQTIMAGNDWRGEFHNKKKNGELFWEIASISPVKDQNGVITNFLAVKEDITDRKRSEEALRHAQKLESIGTLAGGIAHDFNNLLNAIMGQSSLALGRLPKESPAGDNIAKALKAAERAADLTRQLLAYSGKGKFLTDDFDLNRLVEENAQLLEVSIPKSAHLRYDLDRSALCMRGDIGQVQQVVMNLIINAGEALGTHSGFITVRTRHIEINTNGKEYCKYTNISLPPGPYISFQVSDTGHGIKPDLLARIFDPFFTTKFTGRGLGLAAVLGIIRGHHGGVRIQSESGKGTEFEVIFPEVQLSSLTKAQDTKQLPTLNGEGKTILVIDDEPSVLELLTDVFADANFTVIKALDPVEGIELYRRHREHILLVVLDFSMPGMDGKTAFHELRKINSDVKVLLCSGYTEEEIRSVFGDIPPHSFIQKPYKPSILMEKASSILTGASSQL
jgi:two-component system, cell cycle sensor histidine kinase and response regulator CckA